jgi:hypothetical protein
MQKFIYIYIFGEYILYDNFQLIGHMKMAISKYSSKPCGQIHIVLTYNNQFWTANNCPYGKWDSFSLKKL